MSVVSSDPIIINRGGCNSDFTGTLDKTPTPKAGVQYLFNLSPVHFNKLMHSSKISVIGNSDKFSMLKTLLVLNARSVER